MAAHVTPQKNIGRSGYMSPQPPSVPQSRECPHRNIPKKVERFFFQGLTFARHGDKLSVDSGFAASGERFSSSFCRLFQQKLMRHLFAKRVPSSYVPASGMEKGPSSCPVGVSSLVPGWRIRGRFHLFVWRIVRLLPSGVFPA